MSRKCIVWGAGKYGKRFVNMLTEETGYKIIFYCDANKDLVGKHVEQYEIVDVESAIEACRKDKEIWIVIAIFNYNSIEAVKKIINSTFPESTKIQIGHDIQDLFENRILNNYYRDMKFQWNIDLEGSFLKWLDSIMLEVEFWVKKVASIYGERHEYNTKCRNQNLFEYPNLTGQLRGNEIVLDIGCGLMSKYGSRLKDGNAIQLIPIDALAHFYNQINSRIKDGLKENYICRFGLFEFMANLAEESYGDYIIIENALDHCIDPWRSLIQCLYILKKDGKMFLKHRRAEAVYEGWNGLHQWNIDCINRELIIWNRDNAVNVTKMLSKVAEIHIEWDESIPIREHQNITAEIIKSADFELSDFIDTKKDAIILTKCIGRLMERLAEESTSFYEMIRQTQF